MIFCWVLHEQAIIDEILSRLDMAGCMVRTISLVCSREALIGRLQKDIEAGLRRADVLERSTARIPLYDVLCTEKLDVSGISPKEAADRIAGGDFPA